MYSSRCPGSHSRPHGESMALKHQCSHKSPVEDAEMSEEDVVEENPETRASCVCSRPKSMIICRSCGYTFVGRVRMHCPVHVGVCILLEIKGVFIRTISVKVCHCANGDGLFDCRRSITL